ncbi:hypothetical protein C443_18219 [Haloarcula argentinensis DSM 12282]|nr:hypothetical protein C443_18219 [Haloarcula argentinensis DSM 12282]
MAICFKIDESKAFEMMVDVLGCQNERFGGRIPPLKHIIRNLSLKMNTITQPVLTDDVSNAVCVLGV